ncbi:MAG: hypothetical protein ACI3XT_01195 [Butyricicoccaceae bacterium]
MHERLVYGARGLGITFVGTLLSRWTSGLVLNMMDAGQAAIDTSASCLTAMAAICLAVYLVWLVLRSSRLDKAVNPGLVGDYHVLTLSAAGLCLGALYVIVACFKLGFGNFSDITALTIGAVVMALGSLVSLYLGLRQGTSSL